jgi:hypothetical protein
MLNLGTHILVDALTSDSWGMVAMLLRTGDAVRLAW